MASANSENLHKLKIKEARKLFFISNELLETAKKLAKYQLKEFELGAKYVRSLSKLTIDRDIEAVRNFENKFIKKANKRNLKYKKNIENFLSGIHANLSPDVDKLLEKTRRSLNLWIEKSANGFADSNGEFSKIIRDVSLSSASVLNHGRKTVDQLSNRVEQMLLKKINKKVNKPRRSLSYRVNKETILSEKINAPANNPELVHRKIYPNGRQQDSI